MKEIKYRMYAVSLMAVNKNDDLPPGELGEKFVYWAHRGAVCIAENINQAGKNGKPHVYKMFPVEEGYSMHSVVVSPIEESFFGTLQNAIDGGAFIAGADPNEKACTFNFDPEHTADVTLNPFGQSH